MAWREMKASEGPLRRSVADRSCGEGTGETRRGGSGIGVAPPRYASLRSPSCCQLHCKFSLQTESFPSVVPAVQSEAGPMASLRQAPLLCEMDVRPRCEQGTLHAAQSKAVSPA